MAQRLVMDFAGKLERETGIEPATSSLGSWRSTAELLPLKGKSDHNTGVVASKAAFIRAG
jgi:hypothetical protein